LPGTGRFTLSIWLLPWIGLISSTGTLTVIGCALTQNGVACHLVEGKPKKTSFLWACRADFLDDPPAVRESWWTSNQSDMAIANCGRELTRISTSSGRTPIFGKLGRRGAPSGSRRLLKPRTIGRKDPSYGEAVAHSCSNQTTDVVVVPSKSPSGDEMAMRHDEPSPSPAPIVSRAERQIGRPNAQRQVPPLAESIQLGGGRYGAGPKSRAQDNSSPSTTPLRCRQAGRGAPQDQRLREPKSIDTQPSLRC